jgi:UDP-2,4-diacetamido-2,4,6-trideoxy-beta-L-altropyranose hydrolase
MRNPTGSTILFICDANMQSGMGHFLRCISLAVQQRIAGFQSIFYGDFSPFAFAIADFYSIRLHQHTGSVAERLRQLPARSKVVLDSYHYDCSDLLQSQSYVLIDDFCLQPVYPVAGVINFTLQANRYNYLAKGAKKQALGLNFFLPHPSLLKATRHVKNTIKRILIVIGSGDPYQISDRLVDAVLMISGEYEIKVVTRHVAVDTRCATKPAVYYVPPKSNVYEYYDWADFCITSGGLAKYECAYLAKPAAVISLTTAEQQETDGFSADLLCFDLGYHSQITPDGLVKDLAQIILQPQLRLAAHQSCLKAFKSHSALAITEFVERCWGSLS